MCWNNKLSGPSLGTGTRTCYRAWERNHADMLYEDPPIAPQAGSASQNEEDARKELALRFNLRDQDLTPTLLAALCAPVPKFA